MINLKKMVLFLFIFSIGFGYAHKISGMQLSVELIEDDKILIKGFNK